MKYLVELGCAFSIDSAVRATRLLRLCDNLPAGSPSCKCGGRPWTDTLLCMKSSVRHGAIALLLFCAQLAAGSTPTAAKDRLYLSIAQERAILRSIKDQGVKTDLAPSGFRARIGGVVPPPMELHDMPAGATRKVWAVRGYSYVLLKNRLLIVDPKVRKIVGIIWR